MPFVVLTVDQFVRRGDGTLKLQKQDSHVYRKTGTLSPISWENQSRQYIKRRSLKKLRKGYGILDV